MRGGAGLGQAEVGRVDGLGARAVSDVRASRATQEHQALGPVDVLGAHVSAVFGPALCPEQGGGDGAVGVAWQHGWRWGGVEGCHHDESERPCHHVWRMQSAGRRRDERR